MRSIKQYYERKNNLKTFNQQWAALLDNVLLPTIQRMHRRTLGLDIIDIRPLGNPIGEIFYMDYQHLVTTEQDFSFWKIKVIFKDKIK